MTALQTLDPPVLTTAPPSAVVWIDGLQAILAMMSADGQISTGEVNRGREPEFVYLARVVNAIGDRERVLILGPSSVRQALERDYVAIYGRPDRLVDVEPADMVALDELVDRLHTLAA